MPELQEAVLRTVRRAVARRRWLRRVRPARGGGQGEGGLGGHGDGQGGELEVVPQLQVHRPEIRRLQAHYLQVRAYLLFYLLL